MAIPAAEVHAAHELAVGLSATFEREITEVDILEFARVSGDYNPLHVDVEYAAGTPFRARVAHGAFQVGLASALIGMRLPGLHVLLGSIAARFPAPLFFPTRVVVNGEITAWNPQTRGGSLRVSVTDSGSGATTADISMAFVMRDEAETPAQATSTGARSHAAEALSAERVVMVTGAAGGIGTAIVEDLLSDHTVLAQVRREGLPPELAAHPNVTEIRADLASDPWEESVDAVLGGRALSGVVHAAWPEGPRGGLLDAPDAAIDLQVSFGSTITVRLARYLAQRVGDGGRFVVLGSMVGTYRPSLQTSAYSLGKATLEHCVRLLAPELARKRITINVVSPAFVPVGINERADERQLMLARAAVPLGRLCSADDVTTALRHLLSPGAEFVTGQTIGLYGGQL